MKTRFFYSTTSTAIKFSFIIPIQIRTWPLVCTELWLQIHVRDLYQVSMEKFSLIHRRNWPLNSIVVGKVVITEEFLRIDIVEEVTNVSSNRFSAEIYWSGEVVTIEYDPDGSADICLLHCRDGEKTYTLHPRGYFRDSFFCPRSSYLH